MTRCQIARQTDAAELKCCYGAAECVLPACVSVGDRSFCEPGRATPPPGSPETSFPASLCAGAGLEAENAAAVAAISRLRILAVRRDAPLSSSAALRATGGVVC